MKILDEAELPEPGDRYSLEDDSCISGVYGKVYTATDGNASDRKVAIKVQKWNKENERFIEQEYRVLRDLSAHANLPDFYGAFKNGEDIWMVMELCEGGTVLELVRSVLDKNRRMAEEHIAHILKETVKGLAYLHEYNVMHRDVKASNILLTKEGEVKLADFGNAHFLKDAMDKTGSCVGSPCWIAPEVVTSSQEPYGSRSDVWSLGIVAIEIGDGEAPYQSMHPTRALFQIATNPPPSLKWPANWSENYSDFINECLVKNPEFRPYMEEVMEHPFLSQIPENNYHLSMEIKSLINDMIKTPSGPRSTEEVAVDGNFLKKGLEGGLERMLMEDLATLEIISEKTVLAEVEERFKKGQFYTFVGDVLLALNSNGDKNIFGEEYHRKYSQKSRSDNAPHIFAVADSAYQNAIHHVMPQRIVLAGESGSGKTRNYLHLMDHLLHLGSNMNINLDRLRDATKLIHSLTHAATPINYFSTRCLMRTDVKFGTTGKISGAEFRVHLLEKGRVSCVDMFQGNFHFLYYIYDGLKAAGQLDQYHLNDSRRYRYLRISDDDPNEIDSNIKKFKRVLKILEEFELEQGEIETILSVAAAVLVMGEIRFQESEEEGAVIEDEDVIQKIGELLRIEPKKLSWALTNYCLVKRGSAIRKKSTVDEARDARDVFANTLYCRLVDYLVACVNHRLGIGSSIFGEKYSVNLFDYSGFECFKANHLPQLFVNTLNEQMQYHYLQRNFSWECIDVKEEDIEYHPFKYYDNRNTLECLMGKADGILTFIDGTSRSGHGGKYTIDFINSKDSPFATAIDSSEFSIAHFTGKVEYNVKEMSHKNRDFLPPEVIETLRLSNDAIVKQLFTNKLDKCGNLIVSFEDKPDSLGTLKKRNRFSSFGSFDSQHSQNQYSQIRKMRTATAIFKAVSLDILRELSIGGGSGGTEFVRCIRPDLKGVSGNFNPELVKQQIRALAVVETAKARKTGYPHRVTFPEFLRRYKFLAFDFDENVEITKENCRLLLIRLKMEGWCIGKTKVFLKYHNEEYLARLYETQVRKIVKIQTILRGFLAKCRVAKELKTREHHSAQKNAMRRISMGMTEDEAALVIQKAYRNVTIRKTYPDLAKSFTVLDEETCNFVRVFARRWRFNSLFHVLLQYRALRVQDIFNFSQQVHLFNLETFHGLQEIRDGVDLYHVDTKAQVSQWLGEPKLSVLKMPFSLKDIPFYDASMMRDPLTNTGTSVESDDPWDSPFRWREILASQASKETMQFAKAEDDLINLRYSRDPEKPMQRLSAVEDDTPMEKLPEHKEISEMKSKKAKEEKNQAVRSGSLQNGKRTVSVKRYEERESNCENSKPANSDFEYIKAPVVGRPKMPPSADPMVELKRMANKNANSNNEDEPPFNFQGMLRKTNFKKDSIRRSAENGGNMTRYSLKNRAIDQEIVTKIVSMELAPGIFIEGVEVEL